MGFHHDVLSPNKPFKTLVTPVLLFTESLPQTSPAVIVGACIGAVIGVIIIAVVAYLLVRVMRSSHAYEG